MARADSAPCREQALGARSQGRRGLLQGLRWEAARSFSDPTVFVGLGPARLAERVRVIWPSGTVQDAYGLHADTQHILEEPPLFLVEPRARRGAGRGEARSRQ